MNIFEIETGNSLRIVPGTWVHRIPDTNLFKGYGLCANCEAKLTGPKQFHGNMMTQKQPSDWLAVRNGKAYFIECKSTTNPISYNMKWIAEHQITDGLEIEKAGGTYYFVLCRRKPRDMDAWVLLPSDVIN